MQQLPLAYLNGSFVSFNELKLPVYDLGLVQGATVTERLRTFAHQPHLLNEHLQRLRQSAAAIGLSVELVDPLTDVVKKLLAENSLLPSAPVEFSIVIFLTAGDWIGDANGLIDHSTPTVCAYTAPLPVDKYHAWYQQGVKLLTSHVRQIPAASISPQIKMRSRLHWYLAEQEVQQRSPGAMALLLDQQGHLTETSSGNLFLVKDNELLTPPLDATLNGIAQQFVVKLAQELNLTVNRQPLSLEDVVGSDESFLTSSTYCILPVQAINEHAFTASIPGPVTQQLSRAWAEQVGIDFRSQERS